MPYKGIFAISSECQHCNFVRLPTLQFRQIATYFVTAATYFVLATTATDLSCIHTENSNIIRSDTPHQGSSNHQIRRLMLVHLNTLVWNRGGPPFFKMDTTEEVVKLLVGDMVWAVAVSEFGGGLCHLVEKREMERRLETLTGELLNSWGVQGGSCNTRTLCRPLVHCQVTRCMYVYVYACILQIYYFFMIPIHPYAWFIIS